jgi:uncharacterized protein YbbK (DUF523 family)
MGTRKQSRIRVGISACLLGRKVRYDGGHKRDRLITRVLGRRFEWVPVCPEVEMGLGVPRETLRLEGRDGSPRLVFRHTRGDITRRMNAWSRLRLEQLETMNLCGYVLKSDSPSCGMRRVKVFATGGAGPPSREGVGLFARALLDRFPLLPVEEEGRLHERAARDDFVKRVVSYRRRRDPRTRDRA